MTLTCFCLQNIIKHLDQIPDDTPVLTWPQRNNIVTAKHFRPLQHCEGRKAWLGDESLNSAMELFKVRRLACVWRRLLPELRLRRGVCICVGARRVKVVSICSGVVCCSSFDKTRRVVCCRSSACWEHAPSAIACWWESEQQAKVSAHLSTFSLPLPMTVLTLLHHSPHSHRPLMDSL